MSSFISINDQNINKKPNKTPTALTNEFLHHLLHIALIHQSKGQFHGPPPYGDVVVLQAVHDGGPVALHGLVVFMHHLGVVENEKTLQS